MTESPSPSGATSESYEWRVIFKNGKSNVHNQNVALNFWMRLKRLDSRLMDVAWPCLVVIISSTFLVSWLIFSIFWWMILAEHGTVVRATRRLQAHMYDGSCLANVKNLVDIFLFSIETQQSIGYGLRVLHNSDCFEVVLLLCVQGFFGYLITVFFVEIIFKKMTQGRLRTESLLFSKNAVICRRLHGLSLMFRIGDIRNSYIMTPSLMALLLRIERKQNIIVQRFIKLNIGYDRVGPDLFLVWPVVLVHEINEESPLYGISADDLPNVKFEIVISVKGVVSSTGLAMRARTSYTNEEIFWGQRFEPIVSYNDKRKCYEADFAKFHSTFEVETPKFSARELDEQGGLGRSSVKTSTDVSA